MGITRSHDGRTTPAGRAIVALPFLSSGAALVAYLVSGLSLLAGLLLAAVATTFAAVMLWRRLPPARRPDLARRLRRGLIAGLAATAAYDLVRLVLVRLFDIQFWPFDIFSRFGALLVGDRAPTAVVDAAGFVYHYLNGCGFAMAFVLFVATPTIPKALAWAGILELFMVSLYPGWLGLQAMDEFLSVSVVGHVVYGLTLGVVIRHLTTSGSKEG